MGAGSVLQKKMGEHIESPYVHLFYALLEKPELCRNCKVDPAVFTRVLKPEPSEPTRCQPPEVPTAPPMPPPYMGTQ